jgi:signal transduction histidine kinase
MVVRALIWLYSAFLVFTGGAQAGSLLGGHSPLEFSVAHEQPVGRQMQLFYDPSGDMSLDQVVAADARGEFQPSTIDIPSLGYRTGATWVRFDIVNSSLGQVQRWLHANWIFQQYYTVYLVKPDGSHQTLTNGTETPIAERPLPSRHILFPITLESGESLRVYLREAGRAGIVLDLTLWPPAALLDEMSWRTMLRNLGLGSTLIVVVFSIFAWQTHRRHGLLFMAPAQIFMVIFLVGYDGFLFDLLPNTENMLLGRVVQAFGLLTLLFHILFAREFLQLAQLFPSADRIMQLLAWVCGIALVALMFANFPRVVNLLVVILISSITLIALRVAWRGGDKVRGYVAAWGLLWLGGILHSAQLLGWAGHTSYLRDIPFFTLIASAMVITYAIYLDLENTRRHSVEVQQRLLTHEKNSLEQLSDAVSLRTQELSQALERAEAANRTKTIFLSSMSHELRTPLHNVLGYTALLKRKSTMDSRRHLDVIERSGRHLLYLIDDLLQYARNDSSPAELRLKPMLLVDLCDQLAEHGHLMAQQQNNRLEIECDPDLPVCVEADVQRLRQVMLNLLGNACKYTRNGQIRIGIHSVAVAQAEPEETAWRHLLFAVEDTGCGIPGDDVQRIFEPFERLPAMAHQPGLGLGLAIAQQWVGLMGTKIEVDSMPGRGSRFSFTLRLRVVAEPDKQLASVRSKVFVTSHELAVADPEPDLKLEQNDVEAAWLLPPQAELNVMRALLEGGRLTALRRYAEDLAQTHPESSAFAMQVRSLALSVDLPGLQMLLTANQET